MLGAASSCFRRSGWMGRNGSSSWVWCWEPSGPRQTLRSAYSVMESPCSPGPPWSKAGSSAGLPCHVLWTVTALVGQGVLLSSLVHFSHLLLGPLPPLSPPSFLSVGFWIFLLHLPAPISSLAGLLGDFPPPPVWHIGHLPSVPPFSTHIPQRHQTLRCNVCDFAPHFSQECPSLCPPQIGSYLPSI